MFQYGMKTPLFVGWRSFQATYHSPRRSMSFGASRTWRNCQPPPPPPEIGYSIGIFTNTVDPSCRLANSGTPGRKKAQQLCAQIRQIEIRQIETRALRKQRRSSRPRLQAESQIAAISRCELGVFTCAGFTLAVRFHPMSTGLARKKSRPVARPTGRPPRADRPLRRRMAAGRRSGAERV